MVLGLLYTRLASGDQMSSFKVSKFFTVVSLVVMGFIQLTAEAKTYAQCVADCNSRIPTTGNTQDAAYSNAVRRADECKADECAPIRETQTECKGLLSSYQEKNQKTAEECAKSEQASVPACIAAANACGQAPGISSSAGGDSGNAISNIIGLLSSANSVQSSDPDSEACTIADEESRQDEITNRIQTLRDEQQDSVTKQADLDGEISDKEKEIKEEIRKEKDNIQQSLRDLKKEEREKFSSIQKGKLEAKKKKFRNLSAINKKNTEIANLEFAQQQINIEFSESKVARKCFAKTMALKDVLTGQAPAAGAAPGAAKPPTRRISLKESSQIKKQLREEEDDCLKTERLSRSAQLKGKLDRREELSGEVDDLLRENTDEDAAIKLDEDEFEKFKLSVADEEKSKLDSQVQLESNLNTSLAQFKTLVDRKKASLDVKVNSRNETIEKLLLAKQSRKKRYSEVSASLFTRAESLDSYLGTCCQPTISSTGRRVQPTDPNCRRLRSDSRSNQLDPVSTGTGVRTGN